MSSNIQIINLWVEYTNLNHTNSVKHHITVPLAYPINSTNNALTLLALCLLPDVSFNGKPKVNPHVTNITPDIVIPDTLRFSLDTLWVITRELTDKQLKKAKHKCESLIYVGAEQPQVTGQAYDIAFDNQFIQQVKDCLTVKLDWNILIDEQIITVTDKTNYIEGRCVFSQRFSKLATQKQKLDLTG